MHDVVSGYANGTTVNMLPIDGCQKPAIVRPPKDLVTTFDSIAVQAERRREEMITESRTLGALRNALLPKLISGELRVKDAANFLKTVGM
jgi:type I restriction enzyme, S subunit